MDEREMTREQLLEEIRQLRHVSEAKQEQWRLFSQATTNMLWNWCFDDDTVERSIGFQTAFGYSRDEILPGVDWWVERLHPDDRPRVLERFSMTRDTGRPRCSYDYRFRRRDGSFADIHDNVFILYDDEHSPVRALGAMTDISERVRMEKALRDVEVQFRRAVGNSNLQRDRATRSQRVFADVEDALRLSTAIVSNLAEGVVLVRVEDGQIAFTNPRFDQMFGYEPGELVGQPATILGESPESSAEQAREIRAILRRDGLWRGEARAVTKDGRPQWCHVTASVLETAQFGPVHLALHTDINEERRIVERQKLITEELDHRVKNNLASIVGLATQTAQRADSIEGFLESFTARLHAMARVHEALAAEGWAELDLAELVDETVRTQSGTDGRVTASGPACRLSAAEASALGSVLHELATNATKYGAMSSPGGRIEITWREEPGGLALEWVEVGGGPVGPDPEPGFGLVLVRGLVEHELGGEVAFGFSDRGVHHMIRVRRGPA